MSKYVNEKEKRDKTKKSKREVKKINARKKMNKIAKG